jgi:hypothetical protein
MNQPRGFGERRGTSMSSEHERETAFLRRCVRYDLSATGRQLDERISQVQRDERCLRRASWLMALVAGLATAGLGYGAVFIDDFPTHMSAFTSQFAIKIFCTLGIGSLICLLAFTGIWLVYRRELNQRREECRGLVTKLLEAHLGEPQARRRNGDLKEEAIALRSRIASAPPIAADRPKGP